MIQCGETHLYDPNVLLRFILFSLKYYLQPPALLLKVKQPPEVKLRSEIRRQQSCFTIPPPVQLPETSQCCRSACGASDVIAAPEPITA